VSCEAFGLVLGRSATEVMETAVLVESSVAQHISWTAVAEALPAAAVGKPIEVWL
jgi:hypothetical protein